MAPSTVSTYISGISHEHKINDIKDNTKSFLVSKLLEGLRRKRPQKADVRTPITLDMLKQLINALHFVCRSNYEECLFASAFSLAFFAMLRISEFTVPNKTDADGHALNFKDVLIKQSGKNPEELHIILRSSKTDQKSHSVTLLIEGQSDKNICPIFWLNSYLKLRFSGIHGSNKLFVHFEGSVLCCSSESLWFL